MTAKEAIEWISGLYPEGSSVFSKTTQALDMAISALEKQIAKKPIVENVNSSVIHYKLRIFRCPQCKTKIIGKHCEYCGQAICWEN